VQHEKGRGSEKPAKNSILLGQGTVVKSLPIERVKMSEGRSNDSPILTAGDGIFRRCPV